MSSTSLAMQSLAHAITPSRSTAWLGLGLGLGMELELGLGSVVRARVGVSGQGQGQGWGQWSGSGLACGRHALALEVPFASGLREAEAA